jgi:hypothetical protein
MHPNGLINYVEAADTLADGSDPHLVQALEAQAKLRAAEAS